MFNISFRIVVALFFLLGISSVSAQTKVVVIPLFGDDAPEPTKSTPKTIFITSEAFDSNFGGVAGADTACQAASETNTQLDGKMFKAYIGEGSGFDKTVPERSAFILHVDSPYMNVSGQNVFSNGLQLINGDIDNPVPILYENGAVPPRFIELLVGLEKGGSRSKFGIEGDCSVWSNFSRTRHLAIYYDFIDLEVALYSLEFVDYRTPCETPGHFICMEQ